MEDSKRELTKFITTGNDKPEEKTRVKVPGQKEWYMAAKALSMKKSMQWLGKLLEYDQILMMSYDGRRSEEVVTMGVGIQEREDFLAGVQPIAEYLKTQRKRRESGD